MSDDESADDPFAALDDVDVESDPFTDLGEVTPGDDPFEDLSVEPTGDAAVTGLLEPEVDDEEDIVTPLLDEDVEVIDGEAIVPKRRYCEQCEYFSAPPDVACANDRTEIRELVDMKHFRVYRCPVVARRLGRRGSEE